MSVAYAIRMEAIMEISKTIKIVRDKLNLTQTQLAEALNVSYTTVNRWENEKVVPSKLALKSFEDFCENNFIDFSKLK